MPLAAAVRCRGIVVASRRCVAFVVLPARSPAPPRGGADHGDAGLSRTRPITVLNATGYVVAQRKAAVASKATGRLEWLGVQEGSRVKKGEVIARLESQDVAATRDQAGGQRAGRAGQPGAGPGGAGGCASAQLKRIAGAAGAEVRVARPRTIPRWRGPTRRARPWAAPRPRSARREANRRAAEVAVEQTLIRAPFDGVVLTKNANVGDTITPFSSALDTKGAVVTMADMSTLEVEADVSESNLQKVQGRPALRDRARRAARRAVSGLRQPHGADGGPLQGHGDDQDPLPRAGPAHPARHEREGGVPVAGSAAPSSASRDRRSMPRRSSSATGAAWCSWCGTARLCAVPVQTGRKLGDLVEVTQGLQPGDKVVLRPSDKLRGRHGRAARQEVTRRRLTMPTAGRSSRSAISSKAYRRGGQVVPVLTDINLDIARRRVRRADGAVRVGQEHAAQPDRRHRQARRRRACASAGWTSPRCPKRELADWRARRRLHLPVLQPDAGADRVRERGAAAAADPPVARASGASTWSGAGHGRPLGPHDPLSLRAFRRPAAARGHRARHHHRPGRSSWPTSRPATSTGSRRPRCSS